MYMTGQNLQLHLLQGRAGGAAETVRVEDERVEHENQDDGPGPDKEMSETGTVRTRTRFWRRTTGGGRRRRRRRRRRSNNIRFRRTMLMSIICWISSTGP
jgi:hypothetical protein